MLPALDRSHADLRQLRLCVQPLCLEQARDALDIEAAVEHGVLEVIGDGAQADDPRHRGLRRQTEPAAKLRIALSTLQRAVAADQLRLVDQDAPSGESGGTEQFWG